MSVYSAVGNIPEELMRNILRTCGVKLVESENDAVYRNDSYVSVASPYGGVKTIEFDHYVDVYDVFKGEYIAKNVLKVDLNMEAGTAVLLRAEKHTDGTAPDNGSSGNGKKAAVIVCSAVAAAAVVSAATVFVLKKRKKLKK